MSGGEYLENPKVVILCGGKGTRLREETETKPEGDAEKPDKPEEEKASDEADSSKLNPVDRAERAVAQMKIENEKFEKLVKEQQKAAAELMLGGRAGAGVKVKMKEETAKEYADRVMKNQLGVKKDGGE